MAELKSNLVIAGQMNPAIHHPAWYRYNSLLDDDELQKASNVIVVPPLSRFQTSTFHLLCGQDRWQISAVRTDRPSFDRMVDIGVKVFDDLLPHTPVSAFGFNFEDTRELKDLDVQRILVDYASELIVGWGQEGETGAEFVFTRTTPNRRFTIRMKPGDSPHHLQLKANVHHEIRLGGEYQRFDLAGLLKPAASTDRLAVEKMFDSLVEAVVKQSTEKAAL